MTLQITRVDLVTLAAKALEIAPELDEKTEREIRKIAMTVPRVLFGSWYSRKADCGCLVGSLLGEEALDIIIDEIGSTPHVEIEGVEHPLARFGLRFDELLEQHLGRMAFGEDGEPVEVIG